MLRRSTAVPPVGLRPVMVQDPAGLLSDDTPPPGVPAPAPSMGTPNGPNALNPASVFTAGMTASSRDHRQAAGAAIKTGLFLKLNRYFQAPPPYLIVVIAKQPSLNPLSIFCKLYLFVPIPPYKEVAKPRFLDYRKSGIGYKRKDLCFCIAIAVRFLILFYSFFTNWWGKISCRRSFPRPSIISRRVWEQFFRFDCRQFRRGQLLSEKQFEHVFLLLPWSNLAAEVPGRYF